MKALDYFRALDRVAIWVNDRDKLSVAINEDSCRTFCAYAYERPLYAFVLCNARGNPIRFRSAEAAARAALKHRADTPLYVAPKR